MKTYKVAALLSVLVSALSCSYLNVVPPEQPGTNDMMVDEATTLNMLYSCYSYAQENISMPMFRNADMGGTDEAVGLRSGRTWDRGYNGMQLHHHQSTGTICTHGRCGTME